MFSTIIAGVDGRAGGRDAIALRAALASATGTRLLPAHIVRRAGLLCTAARRVARA